MKKKLLIAITGRPGIGKTTAVIRLTDILLRKGMRVGGIYTREIREHGSRVGFEVIDIMTGERGLLAKIGYGEGPRIGKYTVVMEDFERIGVRAIYNAMEKCDIVVVDEIGPMELKSLNFIKSIERLLTSEKTGVFTVHQKAKDPVVVRVKRAAGDYLITLTEENRDQVVELVLSKIMQVR